MAARLGATGSEAVSILSLVNKAYHAPRPSPAARIVPPHLQERRAVESAITSRPGMKRFQASDETDLVD